MTMQHLAPFLQIIAVYPLIPLPVRVPLPVCNGAVQATHMHRLGQGSREMSQEPQDLDDF